MQPVQRDYAAAVLEAVYALIFRSECVSAGISNDKPRVDIERNPCWTRHLNTFPLPAADLDRLIDKLFIRFLGAGQFKRVRDRGFSLIHAGDDIRAADPMRFGKISRRPMRGMIRMGMIEADEVFSALPAFALDSHELAGIDVVPVLGRVGARVAAARGRNHGAGAVIVETPEQDPAAFVGIGLFAVLPDRGVMSVGELEHCEGN